MKKTTLAILLLLGVVTGASIRNRIQNPQSSLAETFTGTAHTCQSAITRINAGPADYSSVIKAGTAYTDDSFPATSEMIRWSDYPGAYSMTNYASASKYQRISANFKSPALFGSFSSANDIEQGQVSDCFWLTATSEIAESGRIVSTFLTKTYNSAGIFAVQLWIKGLPTVITVDDYVPFYNGGLVSDRQAPNGAFWGVILEKVFAKINGNYENINYGW
jgi:hypothetical protein